MKATKVEDNGGVVERYCFVCCLDDGGYEEGETSDDHCPKRALMFRHESSKKLKNRIRRTSYIANRYACIDDWVKAFS